MRKEELSFMNVVMERMRPGLPRKQFHMVYALCPNAFKPLTYLPLAKDNDFDVVLIDTAGRMQDNEVSDVLCERHAFLSSFDPAFNASVSKGKFTYVSPRECVVD